MFNNKTILITGASRGIGKAIALKLARVGANIAVVAKTVEPHPKLEGTIHSAVEEINRLGGGKAAAFALDIRDEKAIRETVQDVADRFGGIDILVNNASAINLAPIAQLDPKRFDLMHDINIRGTLFMSQACVPFLKQANNPHILSLSPPINLQPKWFAQHAAYTISKYGMSMVTIGLAEELRAHTIAANSLWPKTTIATAAIRNLPGGEQMLSECRRPEIVADAAYFILQRPARLCTGNFFVDEEVLAQEGINDFEPYAVRPGSTLAPDFFL